MIRPATSDDEQQFLRKLYWYSFAVRFMFGMAGWVLLQLGNFEFVRDAAYYEELGSQVANDWLKGRSSEALSHDGFTPHKARLMIVFIAVCYTLMLGWRALPVIIFLNAILTAYTPLWTYRITRQLGGSMRAARWSGWIIAVTPAFAFWSGALYKEGLIMLALNIAIYYLFELQKAWSPRSLVILALCVGALSALRLYLAAIVSMVLCLSLLLGQRQPDETAASTGRFGGRSAAFQRRRRLEASVRSLPTVMIRQLLIAAIFVVGMVVIGFTDQVQNALPADIEDGIAQIGASRNDLAENNSGYLTDAEFSNLSEAIDFLPLGFLYFVCVPFPWQFGSLRQNIAIPDTTLWLMMYPFIVVGLFRSLRTRFQGTISIIVVTFAICCFYALFVGNAGTAYRLRIQVWLLWAPFIGIGWESVPWPQRSAKALGQRRRQLPSSHLAPQTISST
ncbi:MAG TPA: hypothetical protein VG713_18770 [Pirellulales bacterium]|nr:hypothetical protein [Pirellulales bacterium]